MGGLDKDLKELSTVAAQIYKLENELQRKRDKRNRLALRILETGKYSYRKIASHAGFKNTYLAQLRKKQNA